MVVAEEVTKTHWMFCLLIIEIFTKISEIFDIVALADELEDYYSNKK